MRPTQLPTLSLLLALPTLAAAAAFTDVAPSAWYAEYVQEASDLGFIEGYRDRQGKLTGRFGPDATVTVAEAVKMAIKAAGHTPRADRDSSAHWSQPYYAMIADKGIELPDSLTTNVDRPVTRGQVAIIFAEIYEGSYQYGDVLNCNYADVPYEYKDYFPIEVVTRLDIMVGDGRDSAYAQEWGDPPAPCNATTFRPHDKIIRAEMAKIAVSARQKLGTRDQALNQFQ